MAVPLTTPTDRQTPQQASPERDLEQLETELLLEAVYRRYGLDFRQYAQASLKRRLYRPIVLTGANADGADGLARIKACGGVAIVQDPSTSLRRAMPDAAIAATNADAVLPLEEIPAFLYGLCA